MSDPFVFEVDYITNQSLVNRLQLAGYKVTTETIEEMSIKPFLSKDMVVKYQIANDKRTLISTTTAVKFKKKAIKLLNKYKEDKGKITTD